jgi:hypothetical protein
MQRDSEPGNPRLKPVPASRRSAREPDEAKDIEHACQVDVPPLIPAGDYEVMFLRAEQKKKLWGGHGRVFMHFKISQAGPYLGVVLFMSATLPPAGRFSLSSKFLQQWCLAAGRRPARYDRLSTAVFRNKIFLARVRTVTKDTEGEERAKDWHYSVVDRLLEVRVGG